MKKLYIILLLAGLSACSKSNSTSGTTTIEYKYTAPTSSTYFITYTGGDNVAVATTFTGTSFDKVITTTAATGFKKAEFIVSNTANPLPTINGTMTITVNGKANPFNAMFGMQAQATWDWYVLVF